MQPEIIETKHKDVRYSWVSTSRFIWACQLVLMIAFIIGGSYALYKHRYKGKPEVDVPTNTLYSPKYK
ncbi:MAG: hypothetical protein JSR00_09045 [Bacteroidetes bacterium]|nr:hypothetical protein [Bacteroidota bacterium]